MFKTIKHKFGDYFAKDKEERNLKIVKKHMIKNMEYVEDNIFNIITDYSKTKREFTLDEVLEMEEETISLYFNEVKIFFIKIEYERKVYYERKYSMEFLARHIKDINLNMIIFSQELTGEFIDKFADILNWSELATWQTLDANILRKHRKKVDWFQLLQWNNVNITKTEEIMSIRADYEENF